MQKQTAPLTANQRLKLAEAERSYLRASLLCNRLSPASLAAMRAASIISARRPFGLR